MTEQTYHDKFILYLESTYQFKEDTHLELAKFAEEHLPALLHSNGLQTDGNVYSNLDVDYWNQIITDGLVDDNSTEEERNYAAKMMKALKYFKGFVKYDHKANYKKLFAGRLKREQDNAAQQKEKESREKYIDNTTPEAENAVRSEGAVNQVCVTHYERNPKDRQRALAKYGYTCHVCGLDFEKEYGEIGRQYIEIHHLYPVCNMGEDYQFDPLDPERGLIPLCSNCHSMIHRGGTTEERNGQQVMVPMTLQALREVYHNHRKKE